MPFQPKTHKIPSLLARKSYQQTYDDKRLSSSQRGYDNAWRTVRMQHLINHPLCYDCLNNNRYTSATEIHHIKKLAEHKHLRDDADNLMSLCKSCHSKRTANGE